MAEVQCYFSANFHLIVAVIMQKSILGDPIRQMI